jgi:hypothetical protein
MGSRRSARRRATSAATSQASTKTESTKASVAGSRVRGARLGDGARLWQTDVHESTSHKNTPLVSFVIVVFLVSQTDAGRACTVGVAAVDREALLSLRA